MNGNPLPRPRTTEKPGGSGGNSALRNIGDRPAGTPLRNAVPVGSGPGDPEDTRPHQRNGKDAASADRAVRIMNHPGSQRSGLVEALEIESPVRSRRQNDRSDDAEVGPVSIGRRPEERSEVHCRPQAPE